jgi:hypothetical protein|uniref:Uncharacterized protein n=1 Tax=Siphoviridae sp. ctQ0C17 TaxID=2826325 RepID=A0A8S5NBQ4_9CAUD|nr:hypothetical protein [uncultured Lachnoclostridium sp.]DAD92269.1 MAG TPA: hypothetical protein [Siphoviridae sp. ctQ0C17]
MAGYSGATKLKNIMHRSTPIKAAFKGAIKLWSSASPTVIMYTVVDNSTQMRSVVIKMTEDHVNFITLASIENSIKESDRQGSYAFTSYAKPMSGLYYVALREYPASGFAWNIYKIDTSTKTVTFVKRYNAIRYLRWMYVDAKNASSPIITIGDGESNGASTTTWFVNLMTNASTAIGEFVQQVEDAPDKFVFLAGGKTGWLSKSNYTTSTIGTVNRINAYSCLGYINGRVYYIQFGKLYYGSADSVDALYTAVSITNNTNLHANYTVTNGTVSLCLCISYIGGDTNTGYSILRTTDGINFTQVYVDQSSSSPRHIEWDGTVFKMALYKGYMYSEDGITWTIVNLTNIVYDFGLSSSVI